MQCYDTAGMHYEESAMSIVNASFVSTLQPADADDAGCCWLLILLLMLVLILRLMLAAGC